MTGAHAERRAAWARWESVALAATVAAVVLFSMAPNVWGRQLAPPGTEFQGIAVSVRDGHFYLSLIRQDPGASPYLRNAFADPERERLFTTIFWWALAHVRHVTGLTPLAVLNGARYVANALCVLAIAGLCRQVCRTRAERWLAIQLAVWGSGLGWLTILTGRHTGRSVDLLTPEASSFYTFLTFPHLVLALALLIGAGAAVLRAFEAGSPRWWGIVAGACSLVLGLVHPFNVLVLLATWCFFGVLVALRSRERLVAWLRVSSPLVVSALIAIGYFATVTLLLPFGLPETVIRHAPYAALALGYGVLLLGAVWWVWRLRPRSGASTDELWCAAWVLGTLAVLHSYPVLKQEGRALLGLNVPLAVGLAVLLLRGTHRWPVWGRVPVMALTCALSLPTIGTVLRERRGRLQAFPERYYQSAVDRRAMRDAAQLLCEQDRVLSAPWSGLLLSAHVPARIFVGYWDEITYAEHERVATALFATDPPPEGRRAVIDRYGITAIWVGEVERAVYPVDGIRAVIGEVGGDILLQRNGAMLVRVAGTRCP